MTRKKKILVGNWKMSPPTLLEARSIFTKIKRAAARTTRVSVVICPSDLHLISLASGAKKVVSLGVQDVFWEDQGFFTGQISPAQARDAGATFAIVGHSEKRKLGETNAQVALKLSVVIRDGLTAILCIGEKERDRDGRFFGELRDQLLASLSEIRRIPSVHPPLIIAYEPVWEIGRTDMQAMDPGSVHETSIFIRKIIHDAFGADAAESVPIIYGGSVNTDNAAALTFQGGVDGLLVGRQSLDTQAFSKIIAGLNEGNVR